MASLFTRQHPHFFSWWSPQTAVCLPFLMDLDLYDMTKKSETLSPDSCRMSSIHLGLLDLWFYVCEIVKKVIHHCMSVTELLNVKLFFFCARETVIMTGNPMKRTRAVKDWSENEIWNNQMKMASVFEKTVIPHMKTMIQSDQLAVAEVLLSDWLECRFEEQDKSEAGSHDETEWSEEEDGSDSEMSSENKEIWKSFLNNSDPYNPFRLYCSAKDQEKVSDFDEKKEEEEPVPCCPEEKDETEWSEEEDGSDEGASEMTSENKGLWESFLNNSDLYNPFRVYSPSEDKVKASDNNNDDDCSQDKDETEWSEDDSDWSDEEDSEMSAENRDLWESFNSDPYNPLCFSSPIGFKTKASELQQNHTPSRPTASEEHNPEQSTKERAKKVRFSDEITVHNLEAWGSASKEARDGSCWLEMARDRERFKRRVEDTGKIINTCLAANQRSRALVRHLCHYEDISADH